MKNVQYEIFDLPEIAIIGTSAIIETELDGIVGMNSGIVNNPFISRGRYRKKELRVELPISFQFHHTQMDGAQAGEFSENLQNEIKADDLLCRAVPQKNTLYIGG